MMPRFNQLLLVAILEVAFMVSPLRLKAQQQFCALPPTGSVDATNGRQPSSHRIGSRPEDKQLLNQEPPSNEPWKIILAVPAWLVGISGNVGPQHGPTHLDAGSDTVLRNLDMGASFSAEARRGRFGIYGDFYYLSDSDGIGGIGINGLLSKVDMRGDEYIADLEMNHRVLQNQHGWLEVRGGVRYMNVYERLILHPNRVAIGRVSGLLAIAPSSLVPHGLDRLIQRETSALPVPPPSKEEKQSLLNSIRKAKTDPELAAAIQSGDPARIATALAGVQKRIARALTRRLDQTQSMSANWFDPYVGLAALYNVGKAFYLTAKADIGGFGAGSKLTSQDYAGLGCQFSRNVFAEIGYRYLFVDYQQKGLVFDVAEQGAQITVGVKF